MYDLIIIGAGSAGLPAAMYSARYNLKTLVIGELIGGTLTEAFQVDNYPGMVGQSGLEIMNKFKEHAKKLGAEIKPGKVVDITTVGDDPDLRPEVGENNPPAKVQDFVRRAGHSRPEKFTIKTEAGEEYKAKTLILAIGNKKRKLNVPGEDELIGKGVSYCATCDAAFFKDKTVVIAGNGDSAVTAGILLSKYAEQVYLINLKKELRAEPIWLETLNQKKNVIIVPNNQIVKINGQASVTEVELKDNYQGDKNLLCQGVFVEIGHQPDPTLPSQLGLKMDDQGYIKVDNQMRTNVPGVFAAGDNTVGFYSLRQTITAAASGVIAATSVYKYLQNR